MKLFFKIINNQLIRLFTFYVKSMRNCLFLKTDKDNLSHEDNIGRMLHK